MNASPGFMNSQATARPVVLDVGNCGPDHASIKRMLQSSFAAEVLQADQASDALELLARQSIRLVLINRKLDCDYSDGTRVLEQIKADPRFQSVPVMIVTNYAEHQAAAVALGAEYGFGKLELNSPVTHERLAKFLA